MHGKFYPSHLPEKGVYLSATNMVAYIKDMNGMTKKKQTYAYIFVLNMAVNK